MFKSSALLASIAFAADSVNNYTGTLPDLAGTGQGDLSDVKVAVEVDQKGSQVTYDFTVSGVFSVDPTTKTRDTAVGLCYPGSEADKNDCIILWQWDDNYGDKKEPNKKYLGHYVYRAIDVTDVNAAKTDWTNGVIGGTDETTTRCGSDSVFAETLADPWTTWTLTAPTGDSFCTTLSMDKDKQVYTDKTFTMQAKVTDAASTDETAAIALLAAFKTASTTMRGGFQEGTAGNTNAALALTFTEVADSPTDADEGTDPIADEGTDPIADDGIAPIADGASAMTTFAVAIVAVAALF